MARRRCAFCVISPEYVDVERERCAGSERCGKCDGCFMQLARVIDVGVERGDSEGDVAALQCGHAPN